MNKNMMKSMMVACVAVFALSAQAQALSLNVSLGALGGVQVSLFDCGHKVAKHNVHNHKYCKEQARLAAARRHREEMARREAARRNALHHAHLSRR